MKTSDPSEQLVSPSHSPFIPGGSATVGHPSTPLDVKRWATRLGLDYPLALVLRALRSEQYLGTALNYLHREIPRMLMQRWANEVDFLDELVTLADAYATSPLIHKRYRYLRIDTPTMAQMGVGGMAKHPFAAVVARRISTGDASNDVWLETLRTWWVLQFLEAESRGVELAKARTDIGQSIRLCAHDTTGLGPWTPLMLDLRGPADTYRGLHAHLVDRAEKLLKKSQKPDSRTAFLSSLSRIDDTGFPDKQVLDRSVSPARQSSNLLHPLIATYAPVLQPRQVTPHWLEDLDTRTEYGETSAAASYLQESPDDFDCVETDENKSHSQQALQAKGVQLLSIEEQQRLPFSWSKPNPHERRLLQKWWSNTWRNPAHPDNDLAVLTYLATQLSLSPRLVEHVGISTESSINWQWDLQSQVLHRLPPRRYGSAVPDEHALPHLTPLADKLVVRPGKAVSAFLSARHREIPEATSLGQWFGCSKDLEKRVRAALSSVAPRVTPAMFGGWLAQVIFEDSQDPVLAQLLSSNSRSGLPGSCAYAAYNRPHVNLLVQIGAGAELTSPPAALDTKINCAGSAFQVDDDWIKEQLQVLHHRINTYAKVPEKWLEHHNSFVTYLVASLLSTSGARPVTSPFQSPLDFNFHEDTVYVEDKITSHMHAGRLTPIDRTVSRLIRDQYFKHLKSISNIVRVYDPPLAAQVELLSLGKESTHLPFFFYLLQSEDSVRHEEVSEAALESLGKFTLEMQINVLRHRQSTWLKGKVRFDGTDVDHEVINGLLGHAESGTATWGPFSARTWHVDSEAVRKRLKESVKDLGISKPDLLIAPPELKNVTSIKSPSLQLSDASFGRTARAARAKRAQDAARARAAEDIKKFVNDIGGVQAIDAKAIDRLEHLMLRRENKIPEEKTHKLPHPRAALRYEVYCDWLQSVRSEHDHRLPVKRRYLPRLEEPSPFTTDAPRASTVFDRVLKLHSTRKSSQLDSKPEPRSSLASAIFGLIIESRVANVAIIRSLLLNQDFRLVRLHQKWYLEHAKYLDKYPTAPCTRFAISEGTAEHFLEVLKQESKLKLSGRSLRDEHRALARLLEIDRKALTYDDLCKRLCEIVQQFNWQRLPGFCAGYLDGSLVTVALEHPSWYRLHKKAALGEPIPYSQSQNVTGSETQEQQDDRLMSLDESLDEANESQTDEVRVALVQDSRFVPSTSQVLREESTRGSRDGASSNGNMHAPLVVDEDIEGASSTIPRAVTAQHAASALMKATGAAIRGAMNKSTNVRRDLAADLREIIKVHAQSSVTCRMFVDWIHSLASRKQRSRQLAISSIDRYFDALSGCFEQIAYDHDLTKCEEEEVTELYAKLMEARRDLKNRSELDSEGQKKSSKPLKSEDRSNDRYRTWQLALSRLRNFHRFANLHYNIEQPEWSEIGGDEETLSISPRIIVEREFLHALKSLAGNPSKATPEATQAALLLILIYRFGLRAAEATNLTFSDWVELQEESHLDGPKRLRLVLVRSNKYRRLKSENSRRQVPVLSELTELECLVIDRHMNHLMARQDHGEASPLFPRVCGREQLAANMKLRVLVAAQLKLSCSDARVSLHSARHSYANLVLTMLLDGTSSVQHGLFNKVPTPVWIDHVRRTVLCTPRTTRRSLWALARLMGHAHPRTAMRSYVHIVPELTYSQIPLPPSTKQTLASSPWPTQGFLDLDAIEPAPSYLAPVKVPATRPDHQHPSSAKALIALSMLAKGLGVAQISKSCDITLSHAEDLAWLEREAINAYGTNIRSGVKKEGLKPLARHIKPEKYKRFLAMASSPDFDSLAWDEYLITENLQPATLIGPSRQLVLFQQEQFKFFDCLVRQWRIQPDHLKMVSSPELHPLVQGWAVAAGFQPLPADSPQTRKIDLKNGEYLWPMHPKLKYQLDTVLTGIPKTRVLHRCIVVPREDASGLVQTSYELILLVVIHLFMLRAHRSESTTSTH